MAIENGDLPTAQSRRARTAAAGGSDGNPTGGGGWNSSQAIWMDSTDSAGGYLWGDGSGASYEESFHHAQQQHQQRVVQQQQQQQQQLQVNIANDEDYFEPGVYIEDQHYSRELSPTPQIMGIHAAGSSDNKAYEDQLAAKTCIKSHHRPPSYKLAPPTFHGSASGFGGNGFGYGWEDAAAYAEMQQPLSDLDAVDKKSKLSGNSALDNSPIRQFRVRPGISKGAQAANESISSSQSGLFQSQLQSQATLEPVEVARASTAPTSYRLSAGPAMDQNSAVSNMLTTDPSFGTAKFSTTKRLERMMGDEKQWNFRSGSSGTVTSANSNATGASTTGLMDASLSDVGAFSQSLPVFDSGSPHKQKGCFLLVPGHMEQVRHRALESTQWLEKNEPLLRPLILLKTREEIQHGKELEDIKKKRRLHSGLQQLRSSKLVINEPLRPHHM